MASSTPQQMKDLLQSLLSKGLETTDALPTLKALMEDKILSLRELTKDNMPPSISNKIQSKLLKGSRNKTAATNTALKGPSRKKQKKIAPPIVIPPVSPRSSARDTILINRSPILTLWATVVAKKLYHLPLEDALTFGSACAANCAHTKGTRLGIFGSDDRAKTKNEFPFDSTKVAAAAAAATKTDGDEISSTETSFPLMNQTVQANKTAAGLRAIGNGKELDPHRIWKSLTKKLGEDLPFVLEQMEQAADQAGDDLKATDYNYYIHIRPNIPHGTKGWGAHGYLLVSKLSDFYPSHK